MSTIRSTSALLLFLLIQNSACTKKESNSNNPPQNTSPADKVAGSYSGTGKKMPNGVNLGTFNGCVIPTGWENNFIEGSTTVVINKTSDSTVNITMSGGPLNGNSITGVKVGIAGNTISINNGQTGTYSISSGALVLSYMNGAYISTNACLQGLPYFSGWSPLNDSRYSYQTIGHIDFTGIKQ